MRECTLSNRSNRIRVSVDGASRLWTKNEEVRADRVTPLFVRRRHRAIARGQRSRDQNVFDQIKNNTLSLILIIVVPSLCHAPNDRSTIDDYDPSLKDSSTPLVC
jgi:hypothetical protein